MSEFQVWTFKGNVAEIVTNLTQMLVISELNGIVGSFYLAVFVRGSTNG